MRILAFSDLHGEEAALSALKQLSKGFDHIFICGDISRNKDSGESDILAIIDVSNTVELNNTIEAIRAMDNVKYTKTRLILGEQ